MAGIAPAPCPLGNDASPLPSLLTSLPISCVDEEIDRPMNDLQIHKCVAERPSGHPPQDQLGHRVPSSSPQFRVSMELGEGVSDYPRSQQVVTRAGTKNQRAS